jgi:hypothetical protein
MSCATSPPAGRCSASASTPRSLPTNSATPTPTFTIRRYIGIRRNADTAAMAITDQW